MGIRPIDVMRSQEVSQLKIYETQKVSNEQLQLGRNFQNMIQQETQKTVQTSKSDNMEYRYDAKEKGNNEYGGSSQKRKKKEEKKETSDRKIPKKSRGIDILI
ncbi:MAG TPA: hypothetical protein GXZ28_08455 [Clostridiales bacterium]|jgi:hypothetical protein|nr:hypothetical protein [Clostridiales bacterium]